MMQPKNHFNPLLKYFLIFTANNYMMSYIQQSLFVEAILPMTPFTFSCIRFTKVSSYTEQMLNLLQSQYRIELQITNFNRRKKL